VSEMRTTESESEEDFRSLSDSLFEQLSEAIVRGEFSAGV